MLVKEGDDLRQDQLMLQMIEIRDTLLRKHGLDLQLTQYGVIAQSRGDGMVELVPDAWTISEIMSMHSQNGLQEFFRARRPARHRGVRPIDFGPHNSYGTGWGGASRQMN